MVRRRYQLFPPGYTDDQKILESEWPLGTSGHTQTRRSLKTLPSLTQ